jgi:RNA polymerase sigma factor (sigma-70 family)
MFSNELAQFINGNLPEDRYPNLTNEEIVMMYQRQECTFEDVLIRYNDLLLSKSRTWVPGYDQEDLYQELASRLFHCLSRWSTDKDVAFMTYLYDGLSNQIAWIVRKQWQSDKRKANYDNVASYNVMVDNGFDTPVDSPDFEEAELKALINSVDLSENEQICVQLKFEGLKNKEIAAQLGVSGTRVSQIFKGLKPKFEFLIPVKTVAQGALV